MPRPGSPGLGPWERQGCALLGHTVGRREKTYLHYSMKLRFLLLLPGFVASLLFFVVVFLFSSRPCPRRDAERVVSTCPPAHAPVGAPRFARRRGASAAGWPVASETAHSPARARARPGLDAAARAPGRLGDGSSAFPRASFFDRRKVAAEPWSGPRMLALPAGARESCGVRPATIPIMLAAARCLGHLGDGARSPLVFCGARGAMDRAACKLVLSFSSPCDLSSGFPGGGGYKIAKA